MVGTLYRFSVSETLLKKPTFDISCRPIALCTNWCRVSLVDTTIENNRLKFLFNCTAVGWPSDSTTVPTFRLISKWGGGGEVGGGGGLSIFLHT